MTKDFSWTIEEKAYSSHDWRKNTDSAVVVDDNVEHKALKVNDSRVIFINPNTLKEETVDVSRLIRVFVNNGEGNKKSIK
tara:strand:+ start:44 stop:283 length:240 start_codon:yes stop_codon:yes gene_type:complete